MNIKQTIAACTLAWSAAVYAQVVNPGGGGGTGGTVQNGTAGQAAGYTANGNTVGPLTATQAQNALQPSATQTYPNTAINLATLVGSTYPATTKSTPVDVTSAMDTAITTAATTHQAIYVPAGNVCFTHPETFTYPLYGDGPNATNFSICSGSTAAFSGADLIKGCFNPGDSGAVASCPTWFHDFSMTGPGGFPSTLTGNPSTDLGSVLVTGIEIASNSYKPLMERIRTTGGFYKGLVYNTAGGHVDLFNSQIVSNFYNVYIENATGDFGFYSVDLAGTLFASLGARSVDDSANNKASGLLGAVFIKTHFGFGPYGIRIENGAGANGMIGVDMIESPFESVGNEAIYIGQNTSGTLLRSNGGIHFQNASVTFTTNTNLEIKSNASYPVQDYAEVFDYVNQDITATQNSTLPTGTSGFTGYVRTMEKQVYAPNPTLWKVVTGGPVIDVRTFGVPVSATTFVANDPTASNSTPTFTSSNNANVELNLNTPNTGGIAIYSVNNGSQKWSVGLYGGTDFVLRNAGNGNTPLRFANNVPSNAFQASSTKFTLSLPIATTNTFQVTEGTAIASATTIAPTTSLFHITGTTAISTMTPPSGFTTTVGAGTGGCLDFITDSAVTFNAGTSVGQFKSGFTSSANTPYHACYTPSTGLWYTK